MAKNILSLSYDEALDYFMSASNYSTLEMPEYLDITPVLKFVRETIGSKAIEDCNNNGPICSKAINYTMNINKDGKYAIRPITLVNPYAYYFLAREICNMDNWEYLKEWFNDMKQPTITACSLPVIVDEKEAFHKSTTILNWWSNFEQASLELSLEYHYMFVSDIRNCYNAINTTFIAEALECFFDKELSSLSKDFCQKRFITNLSDLLSLYQGNAFVGLPQGNALSDLLAEILLAYTDMLFCKEVQVRGLQCEYKILRYRDDYRIFCNDKDSLTELSFILQTILRRVGFEMNSQKTTSTDDLIGNSIKRDKLSYIYNTPIFNKKGCDFDGIQKHLLFIHQFGKEFPNSGQLKMLLSDLSQRIDEKLHPKGKHNSYEDVDLGISEDDVDRDDSKEEMEHQKPQKGGIFKSLRTYPISPIKENIRPMVAIATQIAIDNASSSHYALRVISQLLTTCDLDQKKEISTLVVNRLLKQPNNDYMQLWLQNITYPMDKEAKKSLYTNELCKIVMGKKVSLWNLDWLKAELKNKIPLTRVCNKKKLLESDSEIKFIQRENYTESSKVIFTL